MGKFPDARFGACLDGCRPNKAGKHTIIRFAVGLIMEVKPRCYLHFRRFRVILMSCCARERGNCVYARDCITYAKN